MSVAMISVRNSARFICHLIDPYYNHVFIKQYFHSARQKYTWNESRMCGLVLFFVFLFLFWNYFYKLNSVKLDCFTCKNNCSHSGNETEHRNNSIVSCCLSQPHVYLYCNQKCEAPGDTLARLVKKKKHDAQLLPRWPVVWNGDCFQCVSKTPVDLQ